MTLHEAIIQILKSSDKALTIQEISDEINRIKIYQKRDGSLVSAIQINARIRKYPHLFNIDNNLVSLRQHVNNKAVDKTEVSSSKTLSQNTIKYLNNFDELQKSLMVEENFKPAKTIDKIVPSNPGLYCIRINNIDALPKPFNTELKNRGHNILYIGTASKSLRRRLLDEELRAKGNGTFFRSIGAVLGYRPPYNSLANKKNKRNYKFHEEDEARIINWINENLLVNWSELKSSRDNDEETSLILYNKPLLNISNNIYGVMPIVSELRDECIRIANGIRNSSLDPKNISAYKHLSNLKLKLNEAIELAIEENGAPMSVTELSAYINGKSLYQRSDGNPIPTSQIRARVKNYPSVFRIDNEKVILIKRQKHRDDRSLSNLFKNIVHITDPLNKPKPNYVSENERIENSEKSFLIFIRNLDFDLINFGVNDLDRLLFISELVYFINTTPGLRSEGQFEFGFLKKFIELIDQTNIREDSYGLFTILLKHRKVFDKAFVHYIIDKISPLMKQLSEERIYRIMKDFINKFTYFEGSSSYQFSTPAFINELLVQITKPKENEFVYDPAMGSAKTLIEAADYNDKIKIFGQEINPDIATLGKLTLLFNGKTNAKIEISDSVSEPLITKNGTNVIISDPPTITTARINPQATIDFRRISKDNSTGVLYFEMMLSRLNIENGRMAVVVPDSFLYKTSNSTLRKKIVEKDQLEAVISLPPRSYNQYSQTTASIIVINNNKVDPRKNHVLFINSNNYSDFQLMEKGQGMDKSVLTDLVKTILEIYNAENIEDIGVQHKLIPNNIINEGDKNSDIVRLINNSKIIEFDYNLNVPRYFQKHIEGVKLRKILEYFPGQRSDLPEEGKLIRIRDLKDDKVDFKLDASIVEESEFHRQHLRLIDESCLLLATRWKTLKPTLFEFSDTPVYLNPDIISFKVNKGIADTAYLINELHADYVQEQLKSYRLGATIPMIRRDDLLEVVIKLPSLEEQRAKVQGIVELSNKIKILQQERNALAHGKSVKQFSEFASLKHTIGRPRQNILDWADNLLHFFLESGDKTLELNKSFADFYNHDIITALKEIKGDINFISEVLEKGEDGLILENYDLTIVPLSEVLKMIQRKCATQSYNFMTLPPTIYPSDLSAAELNQLGIKVNLTLLEILIDNILSNAHKHGFENNEFRPGQQVFVELGINREEGFFINLLNNGKPFPRNYDKEKFITKFSTSDTKNGTGLGGYDINRIAEYFCSDWFLRLNIDQYIPVQFNFWFDIVAVK